MKILLVLLASCVVLDAAQANLLADEVQAILQNTPDISIQDCSTKCDHVFQFPDILEEAISDYQCAQQCACQIERRCQEPLVPTDGLKRQEHHHHPHHIQSEQETTPVPSASPGVTDANEGTILTVSYGDKSTTAVDPSVTPSHHSIPQHPTSTQPEQWTTFLPSASSAVPDATEGTILTVSYGDKSTTAVDPSVTPSPHSIPQHPTSTQPEQWTTFLPSASSAVPDATEGTILTVSYGDKSTTAVDLSVTPSHHSIPQHPTSTQPEQWTTFLPSASSAVSDATEGTILTVSYGDKSTTAVDPSVTPSPHSIPQHPTSTQPEQWTTFLPSASSAVPDATEGTILTVSYGDKSTTAVDPSVTPSHHSIPQHPTSTQPEQWTTFHPSASHGVPDATEGTVLTVSYGDKSTTAANAPVTPVHHSRHPNHTPTQSEQETTSLPSASHGVSGATMEIILTVSQEDQSTTESEPSVTPVHHSRHSHHTTTQSEQWTTSLPSALHVVSDATERPVLTVSYGDKSTSESEPSVTPVHHSRHSHHTTTQSEQDTTSLPSASPAVVGATGGAILTVSYGDQSTTAAAASGTPVHHSRHSHHTPTQYEQETISVPSASRGISDATRVILLTVSQEDQSTTESEPSVTPIHHSIHSHHTTTQSKQWTTSLPSASFATSDATEGTVLTVSYGDKSDTEANASVTPIHHSRHSHHPPTQSEQETTSLPIILTVNQEDQSTTESEPSVTPVHHSRHSHHPPTQSEQETTSLPIILTVNQEDQSTTESEPSVTPVHHSRHSHHTTTQPEQWTTYLSRASPAVSDATEGPVHLVSHDHESTTVVEASVTPIHHSRHPHHTPTQSEETASLPSASSAVPVHSTTALDVSVTPVHL